MAAVIGIDEVGRGCWAGPLVAAAVLLDEPPDGLKDSKLLSRRQREKLDTIIRAEALAYGIGWVSPQEVDAAGITAAVTLAMHRALQQLVAAMNRAATQRADVDIIIDGNYNFLAGCDRLDLAQNDTLGLSFHTRTLVHADALVPAVSAASIIAKVARDRYMTEKAAVFPAYGFESHVGYGTPRHIAALKQYGVCELHRLSYKPIQKFADRGGQ